MGGGRNEIKNIVRKMVNEVGISMGDGTKMLLDEVNLLKLKVTKLEKRIKYREARIFRAD